MAPIKSTATAHCASAAALLVLLFVVGILQCVAVAVSDGSGTESRQLPYPPSPPLDNSTPPELGHVPYFGPHPFETFAKWKEVYGPVIGVKFGKVPAVILNDAAVIRKALEEPVLAGRPSLPINLDRSDGQVEGVLFTENATWLEQRQFALHHLNTYSDYGAQSLEKIVQDVAAELASSLAGQGTSSNFKTKNQFNGPVFKILWTMFTGKSYRLDDPELQSISGRINAFVRGGPPEAEVLQIVPQLANFLPKEVVQKLPMYEEVVGLVRSIADFVRAQIEGSQQQGEVADGSTRNRNYVGKYLEKIQETKEEDSSFYKEKGMKSLTYSLLDMIIAGSETISTTLEWAFLYLAKNPAAQTKLHAELDSALGNRRGRASTPTLADRSRLPYTNAVLKEVLRLSSIVPLSVFHRALEPTSIEGYKVEQDSIIIANTHGLHHDPRVWGEDVDDFRPERFLHGSEAGASEPEAFMPFGAGYRVCLGKKVAKETLFLMLASLLQKLQLEPGPGESQELSTEPKVTQVLTPKDHVLTVKARERQRK